MKKCFSLAVVREKVENEPVSPKATLTPKSDRLAVAENSVVEAELDGQDVKQNIFSKYILVSIARGCISLHLSSAQIEAEKSM